MNRRQFLGWSGVTLAAAFIPIAFVEQETFSPPPSGVAAGRPVWLRGTYGYDSEQGIILSSAPR